MSTRAIVIHYHELWLKGRNRGFFLNRLMESVRWSLEGVSVERIDRPGDRILVWLHESQDAAQALERLERVFGVAYFALARPVERDLNSICEACWQEMRNEPFSTFAIRAKRSDKSFPCRSAEIERSVGAYVLDRLRESGRNVRVKLKDSDLVCNVEITPGPTLVYARKIPGTGGLPVKTGGKLVCLLSGGFDSAVAAYTMMKRGAHLSFVHFFNAGARPGESSTHVARELVARLTHYQFAAQLHLVPFEPIQREIVHLAPEGMRVLLYRRMMLRIAETIARRRCSLALLTGDSLGQVASQTLENMVAVDAGIRMPVFRPLVGTDKQEILALARRIGTYEISAEPFHDCCPVFLPRSPALRATGAELDQAESRLDIDSLIQLGLRNAAVEKYRLVAGEIERVAKSPAASSPASCALQTDPGSREEPASRR